MAKRKAGLGTDAFFEPTSGTTPGKQPVAPAKQRDSITSEQPDRPLVGKQEKTKVTLYFEDSTVADLDAAWLRLRNLAASTVAREKRKQVTKSVIVEWALKAALAELEQSGPDSQLGKEVSRL